MYSNTVNVTLPSMVAQFCQCFGCGSCSCSFGSSGSLLDINYFANIAFTTCRIIYNCQKSHCNNNSAIACNTATVEVRQLALAEILASAAPAAMGWHPATYKEAFKAADAEEQAGSCYYNIQCAVKHNTQELVKTSTSRNAIKLEWVIKLKPYGCFFTRKVAKGFTQIPTLIMMKPSPSVTRFESLWLLLALATLENWEIQPEMDAKWGDFYGATTRFITAE